MDRKSLHFEISTNRSELKYSHGIPLLQGATPSRVCSGFDLIWNFRELAAI